MITKFDNFLTESLSDILYHRTNFFSLMNILNLNKILLSSPLSATGSETGQGADTYNKKTYFLSFSRTKNLYLGYKKSITGSGNVTIVFDGKSLNTKYKGGSVDYWSIFLYQNTSPKIR